MSTSNEQSFTPKLVGAEAAFDELERELNVRIRCFPRWVAEGRMCRTDAVDRLDRLHTAVALLKGAIDREATP